MIDTIIIIGIIGAVYLFRYAQPIFNKVILGLLIASSAAMLLIEPYEFYNFIFFYPIISIVYLIYSLFKRKYYYSIICLFFLITTGKVLLDWNYANELSLLLIIPVVLYFLLFINFQKHKPNLGILTIFISILVIDFYLLIRLWL